MNKTMEMTYYIECIMAFSGFCPHDRSYVTVAKQWLKNISGFRPPSAVSYKYSRCQARQAEQ